jgi:bis(5'-nucleosidyl)-tetraphosphatase
MLLRQFAKVFHGNLRKKGRNLMQKDMQAVKSCGVILFKRSPELSFLLMKHVNRYDLPKGHMIDGETEVECAFRELEEETGILRHEIQLETGFRYVQTYYPRYRRFGGKQVEKTLVIFLGWLTTEARVVASEHPAFEWFRWNPPHQVQKKTIDPLLKALENYFASK